MAINDFFSGPGGELTVLSIIGLVIAFGGGVISTLFRIEVGGSGDKGRKVLTRAGRATLAIAALGLVLAVSSAVLNHLIGIDEKIEKDRSGREQADWRAAETELSQSILKRTGEQLAAADRDFHATLDRFEREHAEQIKTEQALNVARDHLLTPFARPTMNIVMSYSGCRSRQLSSLCAVAHEIEAEEARKSIHGELPPGVRVSGDFFLAACFFHTRRDADRYVRADVETALCDLRVDEASQGIQNEAQSIQSDLPDEHPGALRIQSATQEFFFKDSKIEKFDIIRHENMSSILDLKGGSVVFTMSMHDDDLSEISLEEVVISNETSNGVTLHRSDCRPVTVALRSDGGGFRGISVPGFRCDIPGDKSTAGSVRTAPGASRL